MVLHLGASDRLRLHGYEAASKGYVLPQGGSHQANAHMNVQHFQSDRGALPHCYEQCRTCTVRLPMCRVQDSIYISHHWQSGRAAGIPESNPGGRAIPLNVPLTDRCGIRQSRCHMHRPLYDRADAGLHRKEPCEQLRSEGIDSSHCHGANPHNAS